MLPKPLILVVDDDQTSLHIAAMAVESAELYTVITAENAADGFTLAEAKRPAVIVSDRYMSGETGIDFCRKVKADDVLRETRFILLTSAAETQDKVKGLDSGADDYITKPFQSDELLSRIRAQLRIKALQDDVRNEKNELAEMNRQLENNLTGTVDLLSHIIGLKVPGAAERATRAAAMCRWVGAKLGMEDDRLNELEIAAKIHEIGKISVAGEILRKKKTEQTQQEKETIAQFPLFCQLVVGAVPKLKKASAVLRHQLENFDGTGFPDKLMREEIPIESRLLRAVNFVEQEMSDPKNPLDTRLAKLTEAKGTVLDTKIVVLLDEYLRVVADPSWLEGKSQISVFDLKEGMVLALDLTTGSGMKLLPRDSRLTALNVERILAHQVTDPVISGVYVYEE